MTINPGYRLLLAATVGLASLTVAAGARASGFLNDRFGSDHGQPAMANAYSVYFNPAAMAGVGGTVGAFDVSVAARSLEYDRTGFSPSDPRSVQAASPAYRQANTGPAQLFNVIGAPFLGMVTDLGTSRWRLGIASYFPFGGQVAWQKKGAYPSGAALPGPYDGPQRWATISSTTSSLYETMALAYRWPQARLGLGVSLSVIRTRVSDVRARNIDGSDDLVEPNGTLKEGRAYLDVAGLQVGAAAGVYWEPAADGTLRLGASYTSQPGFGTMRLKGAFRFQAGSAATESINDVDLLQAYPDVVRAGVAWRATPEVDLRFDAAWERWSRFKSQCIVPSSGACPLDSQGMTSSPAVTLNLPRNFDDSVKLRVGGGYWIRRATEVFGSFAYESSPVDASHEDALIFDSTHLEWTLGASHAFGKHLSASLSYTYIGLLPVNVDSSVLDSPSGPQAPNRSPTADGHYSSSMYVLDAAMGYRF